MSWRASWKPWLHTACGITALLSADHACSAICKAAGIHFPPALLGMFVMVFTLVAVAGHSEEAADRVHMAFGPALQFIQRWMPLFYSPLLVALPRNAQNLIGPQLPAILLLLSSGVAVTIAFTARVVMFLRQRRSASVELPSVRQPQQQQTTKPNGIITSAVPLPMLALVWGLLLVVLFAAVVAAALSESAANLNSMFIHHLEGGTILAATISGYVLGRMMPPALQRYLHPVVTCAAVANAAVAALAAVQGQPHLAILGNYVAKDGGGQWLLSFLGVIILSFAFRLYEQRRMIWDNAAEILGGVAISVAFSLVATATAGRLLSLPSDISRALVSRGVTAALGLPIAASLGAPQGIAAAAIVFTGIFGGSIVRPVLDWTGCNDSLSRGIAAASSAHAMAVAALGSAEPDALPFAALAYALTGIIATLMCALPPVRLLLLTITG